MKTFIETSEEINSLVNGFTDGQKTINFLCNTRIKEEFRNATPFSPRLNQWITDWFENHYHMFVFTDEDDFDESDIEGTFQKHLDRYEETGKIHIWRGASEGTIFASEQVNHYFRAWHDYIHITKRLGYDFIGETAVCQIQMAELPVEWYFEKQLVNCEIVAQALHFMKFEEFVSNQRLFTLRFLLDGEIIKS
jgi:hypothetical protein